MVPFLRIPYKGHEGTENVVVIPISKFVKPIYFFLLFKDKTCPFNFTAP